MDYVRIIAPSNHIARKYANVNNISYNRLQIISQCSDVRMLYGLRSIDIVIVNKEACNPEMINFIEVKAKASNLKLEYVNV